MMHLEIVAYVAIHSRSYPLLISRQLSLFFAYENNQMVLVQQRTSQHVIIQSVSYSDIVQPTTITSFDC